MIYESIDKITNTVFKPNGFLTLKHVVKLAHKNVKSGNKELFHKEIIYESQTYRNVKKLTNINLNFNSYLLLEESGKNFNERENIIISQYNIYSFRRSFKIALDWFYKIKDFTHIDKVTGELIIRSKYRNLVQEIYMNDGKIVKLKPTVLLIQDIYYDGIKILINSDSNEYLLPIDSFSALADIICRADLYLYGLNVINYLGRPDEGVYIYEMNTNCNSESSYVNTSVSMGMANYMERRNTDINNL